MSLRFSLDWLEAPGVRDPAEAATWAEVAIEVGGHVVSRASDERLNSVRSSFCVSALPLVEWLTEVWPRLIYERRAPVSLSTALSTQLDGSTVGSDDYWEWIGYHSVRAGRQGGAMPDLRIARLDRAAFAVRNNADRASLAPGITLRFIEEADARVGAIDLQRELNRVVEAVVARLSGVVTPRRARLRERWDLARSEEAESIGRLGADEGSLTDDDRARLRDLANLPAKEVVLGIAEGSAAATISERLSQALTVHGNEPGTTPATEAWRRIEERLHEVRFEKPWLTGWAAAGEFRQVIGLGPADAPGTAFRRMLEEQRRAIARELGVGPKLIDHQIENHLLGVMA